ncbi:MULTISPECIES: WXG100 family type VII secretion target [unclassified Micromonospora]|uniref:WXG100 family type VII secretion target n=1 Tax=unclassified Micromonospora TaxID=2617518 RepID=UPI0033BCBA66
MGLSWEEMCQKVVIDGRPGDVESAALGWEQLIKNLDNVKQSLDTNIKDLGTVWKGPAYEAFKGHVEQIAKDTGNIVADAEKGTGIVQSLKSAAEKLTAAQRDFPVPATCVNDVLEARNAKLTLSVGFFEAKVAPDFLGWLDPVTAVADWINDRSDEAAGVYQRVSGDYQNIAPGTPGDASGFQNQTPKTEIPKLDNGGGGGGGVGGVPDIGGGKPSIGDLGARPSIDANGMPDTGNLPGGSGTHPDLSGGYGTGSGAYPGTGGVPGTGGLEDDYSSGLAGAGGGGTPGLGSGLGGGGLGSSGLGGAGGLGSGGGLGSAGAGAGTGALAGGGALGRAVSPNMGPMMGGGAAGAGRGGGRGGGRVGAGGKLGAGGGMAPGMGGAAGGGAGRGGAGRGATGAGAGGRGAGARGAGMAGMGAGAGAGYGEEETPRNTWLEEDEDVWGADGGGTSGILR